MASAAAAAASLGTPSSLSPPAASDSSHAIYFSGFRSANNLFTRKSVTLNSKLVSNGSRINCMQVVNPFTNSKYETLSYLPPLTPDQIAKQVDYIVAKGWIPCLEFDNTGIICKKNFSGPGYYDGRYWTLWKLPMFGCRDSAAVLREIEEAKKAYPNSFIRLLGFDSSKQAQVIAFVVQKPPPS